MDHQVHHLVDGAGRPLVVLVSPGQANDAPLFEHLLAHLRVSRPGGAQARTRPDRVRADKAYSSRAIRTHLRQRRIAAVIPEPSDQIAHRARRGSRGGRPPRFDATDYKCRNVIERGFNVVKQWRGLATRYDCPDLPRCRRPPRHHGLDSPFVRHALVVDCPAPPRARRHVPASSTGLPRAEPGGIEDAPGFRREHLL